MISEAQRKERINGLGGSDIAVLMGLSNYKTPYQLFLEKTAQLEDSYKETEVQEWGNRLEPIIRIKFAEKNNVMVHAPLEDEEGSPPHKLIECNLNTITHPLHGFMRANIDGFIPEWNAVLEVKSSMQFMADQWGDADTDVIPLPYLLQVAHYVSCVNADKAILSVLIGGSCYREFTYNRDWELEEHIINAAYEFWGGVKSNTAPPPSNMADLKIMYPFSKDEKRIIGTEEMFKHVTSLHDIKEKKSQLNELETKYKLKIMEYMGQAECLTDKQGNRLSTWKSSGKNNRRFLLKKTNGKTTDD